MKAFLVKNKPHKTIKCTWLDDAHEIVRKHYPPEIWGKLYREGNANAECSWTTQNYNPPKGEDRLPYIVAEGRMSRTRNYWFIFIRTDLMK